MGLVNKLKFVDIITILYFLVVVSGETIKIISVEYSYFALCIWIIIALFNNNKALISTFKSKVSRYIGLYVFILLFTSVVGGTIIFGLKLSLAFILMMSPALIYSYYQKSNPEQTNAIISILLLFIISISSYGAYISSENSDLGRMITAGEYDGTEIAFGGVKMASAGVVLSVFLLSMIKKYGLKHKVFYTLILLSQIAVVITSGSTISTICLVVFAIFSLIPSSKRTSYTILLIVLMVCIFAFHQLIGEYIINLEKDSAI